MSKNKKKQKKQQSWLKKALPIAARCARSAWSASCASLRWLTRSALPWLNLGLSLLILNAILKMGSTLNAVLEISFQHIIFFLKIFGGKLT